MDDDADRLPRVDDEIDVLAALVPLAGCRIVEPGCGDARFARTLLGRHPDCRVAALEVDARQHAKNLAAPQERLSFVAAGAHEIPFPDARFDLALMLKSLHHVPRTLMPRALAELARVVRAGGHLYVSEPIFGGALNEIVRLFNDEQAVRAAAQAALDDALRSGAWQPVAERRFGIERSFRDFDDFEQRMMRPTFADHRIDEALRARVRDAFAPHQRADGARFTLPLHVRLLRRTELPAH